MMCVARMLRFVLRALGPRLRGDERRGWLAGATLAVVVAVVAVPAHAVLPSEVLPDPALEARARALSAELRCMVCQNQSIDDSDAPLAADLRVLVRERIVAGDTDDEVIAFLVERYGEFILLRPRFSWHTALLWAAPPVILILAGGIAFAAYRNRRKIASALPKPLTPEEEKALNSLISENGTQSNITDS